MRYYYTSGTLIVRGDFRAASTGIAGGFGRVTTLFNHTVPSGFDHAAPARYLQDLASSWGYDQDYFGLLTAVQMRHLCVLQYDFITVFVTAGVTNPNPDPDRPHTINIIVTSREGLSEGALLETIITATEAKALALREDGRPFTGTTTDAVIVASEGEEKHIYAGTFTEVGRRVYAAVLRGVHEALDRQEGKIVRKRPSYFIFSRYGGDHWVEWQPEGCPYYPCHFEGQVCDFCYCPFYPCKDEELGDWVESSSSGRIWSCSRCTLLHETRVAAYFKRNPEATLKEMKKYRASLKDRPII
ncbi:adenosylcobinamide hydrolase [Methanofollis sp. W23]|uniref:adenosylcobinamide amidohydrolase n=1 Tax=Methanofollis sp. W23 TaxID=2817849 RepID=UPI001AE1B8DD|nr:adenosylcobinamide amidohydrolase [Methanofollis sp. W23]MBP2146975.1 adenosylcobinamide hydrolase [Methanofollis sp. W23]